jgi:hypothetical protein
MFDEITKEFVNTEEATLHLEHSLVSISKWESTWEKPFLSDKEKTNEETIDYIKCMDLSETTKQDVYYRLSNDNLNQIKNYIDSKMTATWFTESTNTASKKSTEIITSEIIYYWMIAAGIPFECQHWHLNKLLTLIRVCHQKNAPAKKMGREEILAKNKALNEARKAQMNTKG